jgi:hypothetical protein
MEHQDKGEMLVQFTHRGKVVSVVVSWKGYAALLLKERPWTVRMRATRAQYESECLTQAQLSCCSLLRDWIKSQMTAIECGLLSFEAAFLSHILLPNGMRAIDYARTNLLPTLTDGVAKDGQP